VDSKERSYKFALDIISFIDKLPKDLSTQVVSKQLLRAATSIGANIIEAQGSASRKDFINFFYYSLKSAKETRYWLCLLRDAKKCSKDSIDPLILEVESIAKILSSSILTLKSKK